MQQVKRSVHKVMYILLYTRTAVALTNAGSATFAPQDTQSVRGAQLAAVVELLLLPLLLGPLRVICRSS